MGNSWLAQSSSKPVREQLKSSPQATPEATQGSAYRVELAVYGVAKQRTVLSRAKGNGVGGGGGVYRGLFANKLGVAVINANVE